MNDLFKEKEKLEFRKLNKNDKNLFIKLRFEYFSMDDFNMDKIDPNEIKNNLMKYFDESIENNSFLGMVCEYKKEIISVAYLSINKYPPSPNFVDGKIGVLLNVFTYPEYRNQGIATELLKKIIKEAKKENINIIKLSATKAGETLYKKLGFKESKYKEMRYATRTSCISL
jgi:GNAT superfamily N-acetyltransferase